MAVDKVRSGPGGFILLIQSIPNLSFSAVVELMGRCLFNENRQVRRMIRVEISDIPLADLAPGEWRER